MESSSVVPAFQAGLEEAFDVLSLRAGCSWHYLFCSASQSSRQPRKIRPRRSPLRKRRIQLKHYPSRQQYNYNLAHQPTTFASGRRISILLFVHPVIAAIATIRV